MTNAHRIALSVAAAAGLAAATASAYAQPAGFGPMDVPAAARFAGFGGPPADGVIASFDRMLTHRPAVAVRGSASGRDALQEAFAAHLWSGAYAPAPQPTVDSAASAGTAERPAGASSGPGRIQR